MRTDEITKSEFVNILKDPEKAQTIKWAKEIENKLLGVWTVKVVDSPEDFYSDHIINMKFHGNPKPGVVTIPYLQRQVNTVATVIPEHALYRDTFNIDGYDIQIEVAYGREGLYKKDSYAPIYTDTGKDY